MCTGKSEEETLEELRNRATNRMTSSASHRSRATATMGVVLADENASTMPSTMPGTKLVNDNYAQ